MQSDNQLAPLLFLDEENRMNGFQNMSENDTPGTWTVPPKKRRLNNSCYRTSSVNDVGSVHCHEMSGSNGDHSRLEWDTANNLSSSGEGCFSMKSCIDLEALTYYPAENYRPGDDCLEDVRRSPDVKLPKADEEYLPSGRPSQKCNVRRSRKQQKPCLGKRLYIFSL